MKSKCICLEDNKLTQTLCPIHGKKQKEKIDYAVKFFKLFQWSTISDGWIYRKYHFFSQMPGLNEYIPEMISYIDIEELANMSLTEIKKMIKQDNDKIS
jgi:hypothetical protein